MVLSSRCREKDNELLKAENNMLKAKLLQQREDEANIYDYLHKKLDANYEVIGTLEKEIDAVKHEKESMERAYEQSILEKEERFNKVKHDMTTQLENARDTLSALEIFRRKKHAMEEKLETLEATLAAEKNHHEEQMLEIERRNVLEKDRIKREMLNKIKESKQCLLAKTEDQLPIKTKRTMIENDQLLAELQYQVRHCLISIYIDLYI
jgi:hypothetical protein